MKKLILTAAAAMMVLASCTKTTVESIDGPKEIAFKKIEGAMTKAVAENLAGNTTMGVFAYLNGTTEPTPYFGNTSFSKGTTYWEGGKYWPLNGQALDFVVYAPYIANDTGKDQIQFTYTTPPETTKTLTFTIKDNSMSGDPASQKDYLYGAEFYDGFNKDMEKVPVTLKHALAKITVNIFANTDNVYTVESLTINEAHQAGKISIAYNVDNNASTPRCSTATSTSEVKQSYIFPEFNNLNASKSGKSGSYLVFPCDQTSFTLVYRMEGLATAQTSTIVLQPAPPASKTTWDSGKHYVYNITLSASQILFDPTVEEWPTSGDNYKTEDKTVDSAD